MSNVSWKGDLVLKQIPLQYDCCVELNLKLNISHLSVDVKFKQTVSHFDDLKCSNINVSELENEIKERKWKNRNLVKHKTYSVTGYFIIMGLYFIGTLYMEEMMLWELGRLGTYKVLQKQVELQILEI